MEASAAQQHRFYRTMAIACSATILLGFASKYLPKLGNGTPVLPIIHVHAVVFATWLALYITQSTLIGRDRIQLHRTLGTTGVLFSILMIAVGLHTALTVARLNDAGLPVLQLPDAEAFLLINVMAVLQFGALVAAGWYFRKQAQTHKRLMLLATVSLMPPGLARMPVIGDHLPAIALTAIAFLAIGPIYDYLTSRRIHRAYLWGALVILAPAPPALKALGATAAWHDVAHWLIRSPL